MDLYHNGPATNRELSLRIPELSYIQCQNATGLLAIKRKVKRVGGSENTGYIFEHCEKVEVLPRPSSLKVKTHSPAARLANRKLPDRTPFVRACTVQSTKKAAFLKTLLKSGNYGPDQKDLIIGMIADYEGIKTNAA